MEQALDEGFVVFGISLDGLGLRVCVPEFLKISGSEVLVSGAAGPGQEKSGRDPKTKVLYSIIYIHVICNILYYNMI